MRKIALLLIFLVFSLSFCSQPQLQPDEVRVRLETDPASLNPVSYQSSGALQVINLIFQSLLAPDLATGILAPVLAEELPEVTKLDSVTLFTYRIREEAQWTNGTPVSAADVVFSLKVLKAPLVNNESLKPQVEFIQDIRVDSTDPRKFTFVCSGFAPEMELLTGDFFILPEYLFDPQGLLKPFTISALTAKAAELQHNESIKAFAQRFNSADFSRSKELLQGSAGYLLENWVTGQQVTLIRKGDWWGHTIKPAATNLTANPQRISFHIIPENSTAVLALQNKQLDVLEAIPVTEFNRLKSSQEFLEEYNLHTPDIFEFVFTGFNSRLPKFADRNTRQALVHLLDVDNIMAVTEQNYATRTVGPVPPAITDFYHDQLKPHAYSLQKATNLLQAGGWKKREDGWYKVLNGKEEKLQIAFATRAGNHAHEQAALIFQQSAAKVGIPVTILPLEGTLQSERLQSHEFEMFIRSLTGNPFIFNFKPLLHTSYSGKGGSNFTNFGTPESDKVLDMVNKASTTAQKARHLKRLQEILHEQVTFVPLYYVKDRIAIHKRFSNTKVSGIKPNYDVSAFLLKK